jgi:AraC-like DNA-binding protein/mannose-6-phosphate isomerase-like protein (cupin superfamily)
MKPILERIEPGFDSSFTVRRFTEEDHCGTPHWHFHPEYEIVFISNGRGKRHIGDHISYFDDGDLIFLGPDLPHFGFTQELFEEHVEIVVQMKPDFLGDHFLGRPEMKRIQQLFKQSRQGLSFGGATKAKVGRMLMRLPDLNNFDRLIELLRVLQLMASSTEVEGLQATGMAVAVNGQDHDRMETVFTYVEKHFQDQIRLDDIAALLNMTVPAFCRYFKKLTRKTFTQFVNEFRIAHACRLLSDEHLSISSVSFDSGFNNISHFNKQFRNITGFSPREYRKNMKTLVMAE